MSEVVRFERQGEIGVITIDNPPVNALSHAVRSGISEAIAKAGADDAVRAVILICAGRTFIAGADITEFGKPLAPPDLVTVIKEIESLPKPVVAAIHGTALGGGLETALACHYRCAVPSARLGVPEVKLGILPGAGGTQRLPRLIGVKPALDMILSGDPLPASKALELGLIDEMIDGDLLDGAVAYARRLLEENAPLRRIRDMEVKDPPAPGFFDEYRRAIAARTRGYFAPERCIRAVEGALSLPFDEGLKNERALFVECLNSKESAALRHVFFAERQVARIPDIPKDTRKREIARAAVIGAGTMGGGIAMNFANAGIPVTVLEVNDDALRRGLEVIEGNYARSVSRGRLTRDEMDRRMGLISGTLDDAELGDADIVIEAVFENMALKKEVFAKLDEVCKPGAILATNTSTLDVNEIAAATSRPQDVIGTHFFSPANVMRLLEIVRGEKTARDVVATTLALAKKLRKVGVVVGVCYGFVGNRMLEGYLREAEFLLLEGATPEQVDAALYDFGMPMGPFAMSDLAGIDVGYRVRQERKGQRPEDARVGAIADRLYEIGRYGQKTQAGFYRYEAGDRTPKSDPEVHELIERESARLGIERRQIDAQEIVERCIYPLINEGARILEEGIALRPGDIDIVWIYGYGFPPYRGGPMFHADLVGLQTIYSRILDFAERDARYWQPAPLLQRLAEAGQSFADYQEKAT